MTRLWNWQTRLSEYIVANATRPFKYGMLDCGLFLAGAIEAITGVDVAEGLRGRYRTRKKAFEAIKDMCGIATTEAIAAHLAEKYGAKEVPILYAQAGDAVVLRHGRRSSLGIVAMHGTEILTPYKDGILRLPLEHATKSYRIG
jgi:hypothetical protein